MFLCGIDLRVRLERDQRPERWKNSPSKVRPKELCVKNINVGPNYIYFHHQGKQFMDCWNVCVFCGWGHTHPPIESSNYYFWILIRVLASRRCCYFTWPYVWTTDFELYASPFHARPSKYFLSCREEPLRNLGGRTLLPLKSTEVTRGLPNAS